MTPDLEPSADLFRGLFEASADAILVVDHDGDIVLANHSCETLFGYDSETLRGLGVEALIPTRFGSHGRMRSDFAKESRARPMGRGLELFARHAQGHDIPVDIALTPITVGGRPLVACTIRDLRGRSQVPENVRVQTTALRSAANGIVITDSRGVIIWVNPAASDITGYAPDELVGHHTRLLKSGQHDPEFYANLWKTVTRGGSWSGTIVNRRRDGSLYHEEQTIAPVVDDSGEVTHFIAIKQDVTEQHRVQAALERAHEELAVRVAEIESLNEKLSEQAIRDPLTSLYNRRYLEETIARDMASVVRAGQPLAIAALDIDHFKRVNDKWGHAVGDRVLKWLADVLRANVRASDLICRVGGEEFLVVMPGASPEVAGERAEMWRTEFAAECATDHDGIVVGCTISIGIAMYKDPREPIEICQNRADAALYAAKRGGRDRVVFS